MLYSTQSSLMLRMSAFMVVGLLICIAASEVSSDVKQEHVLTGKDLHLLIQTPDLIQDARRLTWKCNKTNILEYTFEGNTELTFPNYRGRVTFSKKDYSLLLKNLAKSDIGLYQAVVTKNEAVSIANYNVIVQDVASPVNLTVDPVSSSPDSCNLKVTCSNQDSTVTTTFTHHCSQEGGESSEVMTSTGLLSVYVSEGSVICNHSNQVSWINDTKEIKPLCQLDSEGSSDSVSLCLVKKVLFIVCLIIMVSAVIGVNIMERRQKQN